MIIGTIFLSSGESPTLMILIHFAARAYFIPSNKQLHLFSIHRTLLVFVSVSLILAFISVWNQDDFLLYPQETIKMFREKSTFELSSQDVIPDGPIFPFLPTLVSTSVRSLTS